MIRPLPSPWPYPAYKQQEAVPHTFCYKERDPCEVLTKEMLLDADFLFTIALKFICHV